MIALLVLIPTLIALAMLNRAPATRVAQKVYLPCLMLVPLYLDFQVGGFHINVVSILSLILAVVGVAASYGSLRFALPDLCVFLYLFSAFYSDVHHNTLKIALYTAAVCLTHCVFPYLIGRTLIEQPNQRKQFAIVLVLCLVVVAVVSMWEYRFISNPFQNLVEKITHDRSGWTRQQRWGFGRIAGPYGHAIVAGMVFGAGLLMQAWLVGSKSWSASKIVNRFRSSKTPRYITWLIILGAFMTQSRGPWIGLFFGFIIASIGFARDRRRAAVTAISFLIVAVSITSVFLDGYTAAKQKPGDQDQENAEYRRELFKTYGPLIDIGGLWGWGTPGRLANGSFGWSASQVSIDNEYLRLTMEQGYFGVTVFVLLFIGTLLHLVKLCLTLRNREDLMFAYTMLGIILATSFSLTTVALFPPMLELLFFFCGWSMSIRPSKSLNEQERPVAIRQFEFERVFA